MNGSGAHFEEEVSPDADAAQSEEDVSFGEDDESYSDEQLIGEEAPVEVMSDEMEVEPAEPPSDAEALAPPLGADQDGWGAEPKGEDEMPVYDLATDSQILAKDEGSEGIRAGTGIDASFGPDGSEGYGETVNGEQSYDPYAPGAHLNGTYVPPFSSEEGGMPEEESALGEEQHSYEGNGLAAPQGETEWGGVAPVSADDANAIAETAPGLEQDHRLREWQLQQQTVPGTVPLPAGQPTETSEDAFAGLYSETEGEPPAEEVASSEVVAGVAVQEAPPSEETSGDFEVEESQSEELIAEPISSAEERMEEAAQASAAASEEDPFEAKTPPAGVRPSIGPDDDTAPGNRQLPAKLEESPRAPLSFASNAIGTVKFSRTSPPPRVVAAAVQRGVAEAEPEVDSAILAEIAEKARLFGNEVRGPFDIHETTVSIVVNGEMLTRLGGLLAITGTIDLTPEHKRFRGRTTDKDFGEGEEQMMRARGMGVLAIESKKKRFQASDLNDESAYFREDVVFAFEEPVMFENGTVPSDVAPDLQLVHLRGKGKVLLALDGPMKSLDVQMGSPVTVPLGHLVGWYGNLSPRVLALVTDGKGRALKAGVELSGEGFALLAVPLR